MIGSRAKSGDAQSPAYEPVSKGRRTAGTLDVLLMSLINRNPSISGYELATILREPVPFIWPVKHSQIYPALSGLEGKGELAGEWIEQRGRPNKKVYRLSEQGRQRLLDWLLEPRDLFTQDEILLIVYNLQLVGADVLRKAVLAYRDQCESESAQLETRWAQAAAVCGADKATVVSIRAMYELPVRTRQSRVEWCDWLLEQVAAATPLAG